MNENAFKIREKMIRETFGDDSKIICSANAKELKISDKLIEKGDIFINTSGEFIILELQDADFDEDELVKYVELAEELYEEYGNRVSVYLICPKNINVHVKEFNIKSDADFRIKLACIDEDPCEVILETIKSKIRDNEKLDSRDIETLESLPLLCKKEMRNYYRKEVFKIKNRYSY